MQLTVKQIEEAAFIFERENGYMGDEYSREVLAGSNLTAFKVSEIEQIIVYGINKSLYKDSASRTSAYWALSKRYNRKLIPQFKSWLKSELKDEDGAAVYQILIALSNIGEIVFNEDREGGSAVFETDLNLRDAREYLIKLNI